ncbi:leucine rich repeat protein [Treponema socranskii subsp. socranskii VPI DR56BR1116 = ATCC 35536]|uniref:Leucine rich repeat protein n=1 Tax=Treponema socranskii subsp. socranskii VPI DR56BR1116 = ATCC 35536 TaxID=1125725 RepID=U2MZW9_TRESO|nr:leucine rich repeat protein [Treponema socranskii subsp. socranskii VPI DR56BR1116 = ATCC 35536]ERK04749.1 leucine rich repeat protein [Treponema socranskii subsp. socranskii VPI DR56BR1116 = ATCC 35536]
MDGGNGTLKAKADGIPETDVSPITVEQGKTVTFTAVPAANYKVKEWKVDGAVISNTTTTHTLTVTKAADVKVSFEALPPGEASYTVKHYREKTDGTYPAEPTDSETLNGTAGDSVAFMPKTGGDYEGFTYNSALTMVNGAIQTSGPIQADGSTVVELYYERKTVNVTFKLAGGNVAGDIADVVKTGKYGTALSAPVPVQTGFSFTGWHPVLPATPVFPASDKTYTAQWAQFQFKIDFGVDGGHGTLKAEVGGSAIHSGDMVEHGETVIFIAVPADTNYAVDKWTNNGTPIAGAGTNTSYNHTVTAAANIKVKFKYAGAALAVNQQNFTGTVGDTLPVYKLVTAGSGDYTATPENPSVISVDLNNATGNVTVQCTGKGSSRIKVKDNMSGLEAYSGTVTVQALVTIPDDFTAGGIHYQVVDKTNKHVHIDYKVGGNFGADVHIPATVVFNGETYAITGCTRPCLQVNFEETTAFTVDSANAFLRAENGVLFNKDKTRLIKYPTKKTDTAYTVPDSVETIGTYAFYMIYYNLTTLNLPEGKALTTVEDEGICYCMLLANVNIPSTLRNLGEEFLYWTGITSAVIPEGIESLKRLCFAWCPNLTRAELPASFKSSADIFFNCPALTEVTCKAVTPPSVHGFDAGTPAASCTLKVPSGSISSYENAPIWKDFKKPFVGL